MKVSKRTSVLNFWKTDNYQNRDGPGMSKEHWEWNSNSSNTASKNPRTVKCPSFEHAVLCKATRVPIIFVLMQLILSKTKDENESGIGTDCMSSNFKVIKIPWQKLQTRTVLNLAHLTRCKSLVCEAFVRGVRRFVAVDSIKNDHPLRKRNRAKCMSTNFKFILTPWQNLQTVTYFTVPAVWKVPHLHHLTHCHNCG